MSFEPAKRSACSLAIAVSCFLPVRAEGIKQPPAAAARSGFPSPERFFSAPKYSSFSISPDGKLFAAIVPALGRQNIALIDLDKGIGKLLSSFTNEDVYSYRWIGDRTIEVAPANIEDAGGIRIRRIAMIDTDGQLVSDLRTMGNRGAAAILSTLDRNGDDLVVTSYERTFSSLDAFRYSPWTNRMEFLTLDSPGDVVRFVADRAGQVRAAVSQTNDGKRQRFSDRRSNNDKWTVLHDEPVETASLAPIDAGGLIFDEIRKVPIGVRDNSRGGVTWIDPEWKRLQESIDAALPGARNFMAWARHDSSRIIVRTESDTQPPIYFLLDPTTHKLQEVAAAFPSLDAKDLSARRAVRY